MQQAALRLGDEVPQCNREVGLSEVVGLVLNMATGPQGGDWKCGLVNSFPRGVSHRQPT